MLFVQSIGITNVKYYNYIKSGSNVKAKVVTIVYLKKGLPIRYSHVKYKSSRFDYLKVITT